MLVCLIPYPFGSFGYKAYIHGEDVYFESFLTQFIDRATAIEALRRSQYKFPGRQKIIVSKNWGFTPLRREEYQEKRQQGMIKIDGAYVQFLRNKGPVERNMARFPEAFKGEA